jgi:hypothetical protein
LKGIAWINDDHKINTDAVSDNIEVGQEYTTFALHSHHSVSIRRKPEVDESQLKERLKAYGTIIKK